MISFRIDWFDLALQRTLKRLLQHHSSKASILRCSAFLLSYSHIHSSHILLSLPTAGKTIALTIRTLVGKVISLLFNMLSRFVIAFLPRSRQGVHDLTQFSSLLFREMTVTTFVQIRRLRFRGVKQFTPDHTG